MLLAENTSALPAGLVVTTRLSKTPRGQSRRYIDPPKTPISPSLTRSQMFIFRYAICSLFDSSPLASSAMFSLAGGCFLKNCALGLLGLDGLGTGIQNGTAG